MKLHFSFDSLHSVKNPVVTTGTFDGVHLGHKAIINRLNKLAGDVKGESVLITFHPHPRRVLYPEGKGRDLLLICAQDEKVKLLGQTGLDHLVIVEFTKEFAQISSQEFIEDLLVAKLGVKVVVIGFNHHFGKGREGDFDFLYKLGRKNGFEVEEIPEQDIQNESVSSTKIRTALLNGQVQRANAYLDHFYFIMGKTFRDETKSKLTDYPVYKLHISEDVKLVPPDGSYAVNVLDNKKYHKAVLYVCGWKLENSLLSPDTRVCYSFLDKYYTPGNKVLVNFLKRLSDDGVDPESENFDKRLQQDLLAVDELIY